MCGKLCGVVVEEKKEKEKEPKPNCK